MRELAPGRQAFRVDARFTPIAKLPSRSRELPGLVTFGQYWGFPGGIISYAYPRRRERVSRSKTFTVSAPRLSQTR